MDIKPDEAKIDLNAFKTEVQGESVPVEQKPEVVEEKKEEVSEDRASFNCAACKGEGLKDQSTLCPECNGTGKV